MSNLKYFIPPSEGLKQKTNYKVEVTFKVNQPIQTEILAVGYLNHKGLPSEHSSGLLVQNQHGPAYTAYTKAYYIKVIEEIQKEIPFKYISDIQNIFELEHHNIQRTQK